MAKPLRHITGVKSSKVEPMDLKDLNQWNAPDGDKFIAKHKIEKHADRVGNGDDVYKGKTKKATYNRQESGVYEEAEIDEGYKVGDKVNLTNPEAKAHHTITGKTKTHYKIKRGGSDEEIDMPKERIARVNKKAWDIRKEKAKTHGGKASDYNEEVEIDEAAYSFKAARAGKDIGETGKKFKDIAAKAAERYGSEERGKKVAGAVLAKIRAKHGIKESACNHSAEGVQCEMHGENACPDNDEYKRETKKGKKLLLDKKKQFDVSMNKKTGEVTFGTTVKEAIINEVSPPSKEAEAWIKANKQRFIDEYGKKKGMEVLYAKAWKMHGQSESGTATNTDYVGPGAAGWTTGRLDVGTL